MSSPQPLADDAEQSRLAGDDDLVADRATTKNGDSYTTTNDIPLENIPLDVTIKFSKSDLKLKGSKAALIAGSNFFHEHFEDVRSTLIRSPLSKVSKQASRPLTKPLPAPNLQNPHRAQNPPTRHQHHHRNPPNSSRIPAQHAHPLQNPPKEHHPPPPSLHHPRHRRPLSAHPAAIRANSLPTNLPPHELSSNPRARHYVTRALRPAQRRRSQGLP
jgi:hypothetical protein